MCSDLYVDFHYDFGFPVGATSGGSYHSDAIFDFYANYGVFICGIAIFDYSARITDAMR